MQPAATVYLVTNTVNGHTYVGVTRFTPEQNARRAKSYLHRAIAKYGSSSFTIEPIASCLSVEQAGYVERHLIKRLRPTYNQTDGGEVTVGRRFSVESRERIAAAQRGRKGRPHTEETKRKIAAGNKGKVVSAETKMKMRLFRLGRKATTPRSAKARAKTIEMNTLRTWTPESRAKLSASCLGRVPNRQTMQAMWQKNRRVVLCVTTGDVFESLKDAAQHYDVSASAISNVCAGRYPRVNGLTFQYGEQLNRRYVDGELAGNVLVL